MYAGRGYEVVLKCSSLAGVLDWQSGRFLDRQTKRIALLQCLNAVGSRESIFCICNWYTRGKE